MLEPGKLLGCLRGIVTDEKGDGICLKKGRHWIVDGREFAWAPGARVVHGRVLVLGGKVQIDGELRAVVIGLPRQRPGRESPQERARRRRRQPRVEARAAEVKTMGAPFVRLRDGARGIFHQHTVFEVRDNSHAHLHDGASGKAYDAAVIFFEPNSTGEVLVLGHRVRLVPPPGRTLLEQPTKRGFRYRLAM